MTNPVRRRIEHAKFDSTSVDICTGGDVRYRAISRLEVVVSLRCSLVASRIRDWMDNRRPS